MASTDFAKARILFSRGECRQVGTDTPVAIRIKYIGTGSVTSVTTTTAINIVFISTEGTQTYPFAAGLTLNTVGKLVDAINTGNATEAAGVICWEARVLDSLRSYATASQFVTGAITSATVDNTVVWDVLVDTSEAMYFGMCLAYDRGFQRLNKKVHRVHLQEFIYYATLGGAGAGKVQVVERDVNGVETVLLSDTSVSATTTTTNFAGGRGKITGADGSELIVVLTDAVSLANSAANYLRIVGIIE
jgi:hypothetical protein